jgi:hypothetical protein
VREGRLWVYSRIFLIVLQTVAHSRALPLGRLFFAGAHARCLEIARQLHPNMIAACLVEMESGALKATVPLLSRDARDPVSAPAEVWQLLLGGHYCLFLDQLRSSGRCSVCVVCM